MQELPRRYDPLKWANTGPYLITRVYERQCREGTNELGELRDPGTLSAHCQSLTVLEPRALCPVFMFNNHVLMHRWEERCYQMRDIVRTSFGLHWWNTDLSRRGALPAGSMLAKTVELACPATFLDLQTSAMLGPTVWQEGYKYTLEAATVQATAQASGRANRDHKAASIPLLWHEDPLSYEQALELAKTQTVDHRVVASVRLHLAQVSATYGAGSAEALAVKANLGGILLDLANSIDDEALYPAFYREAAALSQEVLAAAAEPAAAAKAADTDVDAGADAGADAVDVDADDALVRSERTKRLEALQSTDGRRAVVQAARDNVRLSQEALRRRWRSSHFSVRVPRKSRKKKQRVRKSESKSESKSER